MAANIAKQIVDKRTEISRELYDFIYYEDIKTLRQKEEFYLDMYLESLEENRDEDIIKYEKLYKDTIKELDDLIDRIEKDIEFCLKMFINRIFGGIYYGR